MGRFSFWGRAVDTFGNVKPNQGITIYLADTSTPAIVYTQQTGGTGISTAPQITTDNNGRFNFWVDDTDYDKYDQLFDIVVKRFIFAHRGCRNMKWGLCKTNHLSLFAVIFFLRTQVVANG